MVDEGHGATVLRSKSGIKQSNNLLYISNWLFHNRFIWKKKVFNGNPNGPYTKGNYYP